MAVLPNSLAEYIAVLGTTAFVAWGLCAAQFQGGHHLDDGAFTYPPTRSTVTTHGWPVFFVIRNEHADFWIPSSVEVEYAVLRRELATDVASWLVLIVATVYISQRAIFSGSKFSIALLFAVTTDLAVILAWWRTECARYLIPGHPELTGLLLAEAGTPILRVLRFSPLVCLPVLFGVSCLIMCVIFMAMAVVRCMVRKARPGIEKWRNWEKTGQVRY